MLDIADGQKARTDLIDILRASAEYLRSRDRDVGVETHARWRLWVGPQQQDFISLELSDAEGYSAAHTFTPKQLVPADIRELRLIQIWNDLLRARSHRGLERLNELVSQLEGE